MIFIPKTIHVGFGHPGWTWVDGKNIPAPRPDIELGFVIYEDEKGKLRQQPSWDSWRDKDVDPVKSPNDPISGFKINKAAGGQRYSWEKRQNYARVYDPRGWEFEITMENLVFLLKATGYDNKTGFGPIVYAWDRAKLVLLPTNSVEYEEHVSRTNMLFNGEFIKPENFVVGNIYRRRSGNQFMYLGRFKTYSKFDVKAASNGQGVKQSSRGMQHWFAEYHSYQGRARVSIWKLNPVSSPGKSFVEDLGPVAFPVNAGWMNGTANNVDDLVAIVRREDTRMGLIEVDKTPRAITDEKLIEYIKGQQVFSAYIDGCHTKFYFKDGSFWRIRGSAYGYVPPEQWTPEQFYERATIKASRFEDGSICEVLPKASWY